MSLSVVMCLSVSLLAPWSTRAALWSSHCCLERSSGLQKASLDCSEAKQPFPVWNKSKPPLPTLQLVIYSVNLSMSSLRPNLHMSKQERNQRPSSMVSESSTAGTTSTLEAKPGPRVSSWSLVFAFYSFIFIKPPLNQKST